MNNPTMLSPEEQTNMKRRSSRAMTCMTISLVIIPINFVVFFWWNSMYTPHVFTALALTQLVTAMVAVVSASDALEIGRSVGLAPNGLKDAHKMGWISGILAVLGWGSGMFLMSFAAGLGSAWGRPLRIRGRQLHPSLRAGSDWTAGERPSPAGLDAATRRALEALWLHDAQKEHASVPAFARISWLLAAVGAPAELMAWAHRAGLEEIEHTRQCFALAAGYGGRSHSVEPMPELLLGGLELRGDPRATLATESLSDGCQLEDFNADVAAECARGCEEPATRAVLERIAAEERSHAEFSWALVEWLLRRDRAHVERPLREALARLVEYPRPTAVSDEKRALVEAADPEGLRRHGRIPDARWAALWDARLVETRRRITALLDAATPAKAA